MNALIVNCYKNKYYLSSLSEMENFLSTLNIKVSLIIQCEVKEVTRATFISSGAIESCLLEMYKKDIDIIVFNNDLSALQIRNLSERFNLDVIDRTMVIIKIFEFRAKTKEAKLEVEIASLKYNISRLVNSKNNYDQITSGKLQNKGCGEKIIDLKKSQIRNLIVRKEKELNQIQLNRSLNRIKRKTSLPIVTIVGYTNAGKSTLLNHLIKITKNKRKDLILQEDRLFATLDTTTRLIKTEKYFPFLLTDTVGFIASLPTHLIRCFRSTFEEIEESDLIIEMIDVSSENYQIESEITESVVKNISSSKIIKIYNKLDKLERLLSMMGEDELIVSLIDNTYIDDILKLIDKNLSKFYVEVSLFIPYEDIDVFYEIKNNQCVIDYSEDEKGIKGNFKIFKNRFKIYQKYLKSFDINQ